MDLHRITLVFLTALLMQYSNHMVRCVITDVQLVGGPVSNKGTVEIKQDGGDWETTCGTNLDINDAIVICRQLGFTGASLAVKTTPYGQNSNPVIGLICEGNLSACPTFSRTSGCSPAGSASCHGDGYLGCFKDVWVDRALSSKFVASGLSMSISYCIWVCRDYATTNYAYLGVENGNECYCGKASDNYTRHGMGVDSDCSTPCHGDTTESCGGSGYIAVFRIPVENKTSDTPPTILPTWSTSEMQDISTQKKLITSQPSSEIISGQSTSMELHHSTRDDLTTCLGVGLGEGVVIIILSVLIIVLVIYIIRIRRMMKDLKKDQKTQHVDLVQSSGSSEKDTGFYHDIQDVMKSDPTTTSDGDTYYSSQIYEHKRANVLDPDDTSASHHSYMI